MGVYCHMCGEKMNFLRVPMTCKCDAVGEGICTGCEDKLFLPSYKQVEEVLYKKDKNGKYVEFQQTVYIMTEANPKCPDCGKAYDPEEFLDYDDREAIEYRNGVSDSESESESESEQQTYWPPVLIRTVEPTKDDDEEESDNHSSGHLSDETKETNKGKRKKVDSISDKKKTNGKMLKKTKVETKSSVANEKTKNKTKGKSSKIDEADEDKAKSPLRRSSRIKAKK